MALEHPQAGTVISGFAAIDGYVSQQMRAGIIPGLALAIVRGDQVVHVQGFGTAGPGGRDVTAETPFLIGSLSKSFTALAIMQLVEAGKIELDAFVQRYIPWFRLADAQASARITVRELLNQTSGIPTSAGIKPVAEGGNKTLEQRVREMRAVKLSKPVGSTFQYSNANYVILGLIVQVVSGISYGKYIEQHIFAPLEMRHSYVSETEAEQHGLASGYQWWFGYPVATGHPFLPDQLPAGYIISCAEDMARYLLAHMNQGRYGSTSILSPQGMAELQTGVAVIGRSQLQYGMGWMTGNVNDLYVIMHAGDNWNYHADIAIAPREQVGVVILINANSILAATTNGLQGHIVTDVLRQLTGRQPRPRRLSFKQVYIIVDLLIAAITGLQIWNLARIVRNWYKLPLTTPGDLIRSSILPVLGHFVLPIDYFLIFPRVIPGFHTILRRYQPDLNAWLILTALLSLATGVAGTIRAIFAPSYTAKVKEIERKVERQGK